MSKALAEARETRYSVVEGRYTSMCQNCGEPIHRVLTPPTGPKPPYLHYSGERECAPPLEGDDELAGDASGWVEQVAGES